MSDGGLEVTFDDGSLLTSRRLLVTTGLVDELPDVPGLRERWGTDVVHCPYCHGWEVRDRAIAVLASGPMAVHQALLFRQLSSDVTLLLHDQPEPVAEDLAKLAAMGIRVVRGLVERVVAGTGGVSGVEVAGAIVPCRAVTVAPRFLARSAVLAGLGITVEDLKVDGHVVATFVPADRMGGLTAVPGVYVAGNVTDPMAQVVTSAAAGVMTAAAVNLSLIEEDVARAVRATAG